MMKKIFAVVLCLLLFTTTLVPADINFGVGTYSYFDKEDIN